MMRLSAAFAVPIALIATCLPVHAQSSKPGQLLLEYPNESRRQDAKIHPDRARLSIERAEDINHRISLNHRADKVAREILKAEKEGLNTVNASYYQVKAVYELRSDELELGERDLARAEDALVVARQPAPALLPPMRLAEAAPAEVYTHKHPRHGAAHHRRHARGHHKHRS